VLLGEPDAPRILAELDRFDGLVSSRLLGLELRRVALRESVLDVAERLLRAVALVSIDESLLARAEVVHPATVATLDAIHLTTALQIAAAGNLDALFTYDRQLAVAAEHHGLSVLAPS
jgi:predicted nucleic acid-binding protein